MWWQLQRNITRNTENAFFVCFLFAFCASKITAADSWIDGQCSTFTTVGGQISFITAYIHCHHLGLVTQG